MTHVKASWKLIITQAELYLREPVAVFFTLLFAPLMLVMMGIIFGNDPVPMFGGHGQLDIYVPAYASIVIGVVGIMIMPIETSSRRESGVLRRFRATPLRPLTCILSDILVHFIMIMMGILLLFLLGMFVYQVRFFGSLLALMTGICLSAAAFLALGYVLAGLAPNHRAAIVIGNVLIYPMMILSGTTLPLELMPETMRNISRFMPMTNAATLLRGLWFGDPFGEHLMEVALLVGVLAVGTIIAAWTFRWE